MRQREHVAADAHKTIHRYWPGSVPSLVMSLQESQDWNSLAYNIILTTTESIMNTITHCPIPILIISLPFLSLPTLPFLFSYIFIPFSLSFLPAPSTYAPVKQFLRVDKDKVCDINV